MNINEVYLISNLLDENPVFSLAPPPRAKILYDTAIESLIQKKLLKTAEEFSEDGLTTAKRIEDYKSAKKYVKLGDLTFGLLDDNQCVLLLRDRVVEDYSFIRIDISGVSNQLLDAYDFLKTATDSIDNDDVIQIGEDEVKKKFELGFSNCVYLSTLSAAEPAAVTNELIFPSEGKLYLYDRNKKQLCRKNLTQITEIFKERLAV
jgi:hypothetical protein